MNQPVGDHEQTDASVTEGHGLDGAPSTGPKRLPIAFRIATRETTSSRLPQGRQTIPTKSSRTRPAKKGNSHKGGWLMMGGED